MSHSATFDRKTLKGNTMGRLGGQRLWQFRLLSLPFLYTSQGYFGGNSLSSLSRTLWGCSLYKRGRGGRHRLTDRKEGAMEANGSAACGRSSTA